MSNKLSGIMVLTLSESVALLEYQNKELNAMLGELVATLIINCGRGVSVDNETLQEYAKNISHRRIALMEYHGAFQQENKQS